MAITQLRPCRLHYLLALALLQLQHGAPAAAAARRWQPRRALPRQGDGLQPAPQQVYLDWGAVFNGSASFAGDSAPTATKSATTAATAATAAAAPLEVPELPDWADWSAPLDKPIRRNTFAHNSKVVRQANEAGEQLDVALYGDSIVALLWLKYQAAWDAAFGDLRGLPLGLPGSTVEELTYLIMSGEEALQPPPKVFVLLIGINNQDPKEAAEHLSFLLAYLAAAAPSSRVVVLAPLPTKLGRGAGLGDAYREMLPAQHPEVLLSECGQGLDPADRGLFKDGLHPVEAGWHHIMACLRPQVDDALAAAEHSVAANGGAAADAP